jgi:hypothetical protein
MHMSFDHILKFEIHFNEFPDLYHAQSETTSRSSMLGKCPIITMASLGQAKKALSSRSHGRDEG